MTRLIAAFLFAVGCHLGLLCINPLPDEIEPPPLHGGAISISLASDNLDSQVNKVRKNHPAKAEPLLPEIPKTANREENRQQEHSPQRNEPIHPEQPVIEPPEKVTPPPAQPPVKLPTSSLKIRHTTKSPPLAGRQIVKKTTKVREKYSPDPSTSSPSLSSQSVPSEAGSRSSPETSQSPPRPQHMLAVSEPTPDSHKNTKPQYPPIARERGWQGVVELDVQVGINGEAEYVSLYRSSGYTVLDKSAIDAVRKWILSPGTKNGHVIAMKVRVPVHFVLK